MKTTITTGLLCAAIGAAVGWMNAADHYEAKARKDQEAYYEAVDKVTERADHYKAISEEYYADYQDAINREPTTITERVFVRTHCKTDASTNSGGELGNDKGYVRSELHAKTVARITAVTNRAEQDVKQCRAQLHSLQDKIRTHNKAQ